MSLAWAWLLSSCNIIYRCDIQFLMMMVVVKEEVQPVQHLSLVLHEGDRRYALRRTRLGYALLRYEPLEDTVG